MRRVHDALLVIEFALRAIWLLAREPKTAISWTREGKQLILSVRVYNDLPA